MPVEPDYKEPADMQVAIDGYFSNVPTKAVRFGDEMVEVPVPTITGLALALGFCSRQSIYDYEKKDGFTYTIKRARLMIENDYEMQLRTAITGHGGIIFALKNLGWSDRTETELSGGINLTGLSDAQLQAIIDGSKD